MQQQFQQSMQLQFQQAMSTLGDKLMQEMGRQLTERLGEVNESMKQMSKAHNQLQDRVLEQTTTTTDMFTTLKERVEECRRETKEAQEKGDKKLEEALKRMADAAKTIVGKSTKGGTGAGGAGVKDLAGTSRMEQ
jgi:methyl-accepting chemotaxis protein